MANTPIYGFETPDDTDLVKDGALAIRTALGDVDTTLGTALNSNDYAGLVLLKSQVVGSGVSSVTVTSAFNSTYNNYKIMWVNGTGSTVALVNLTLGSTTTGYYSAGFFIPYTGGGSSLNQNNNGSSWSNVAVVDSGANYGHFSCNLYSPNVARKTVIDGNYVYVSGTYSYGGYLDGTTQYTAFTLTPASGTITGGTIYVYGYGAS
jgi:hypothetical protein